MILKVNNQYLDFNEDVEFEKKVKLFEDIIGIQGDFSYSFVIPDTVDNRKKLGIQGSVNSISRTPYTINNASLENNSGIAIYRGTLRIESIEEGINTSFFTNNSEWIDELNISLRTGFNWSSLDKATTTTNIIDSQSLDTGIVWPLLDRGILNQRLSPALFEHDMQPFVYVKDVFRVITNKTGIKFTGDLKNSFIFNNLITTNNSLSGTNGEIVKRSVYIGKATNQTFTLGTDVVIAFSNESTPYFDSPNGNWASNEYTADTDYKKKEVEVNLKFTSVGFFAFQVSIKVDGVKIFSATAGQKDSYTFSKKYELNNIVANGSVITIEVKKLSLTFFPEDFTILQDSWVKVTPVKFYNVYTSSLLPDTTASDFVSGIFKLLNMCSAYDSISKVINTRFFNKIPQQDEIDISQYVSKINKVDYSDFIGNYSKSNFLKWSDSNDDDVDAYNKKNTLPYAAGIVEIDNDYLEDESDLIQLDFVAAFQKDISWLGNSLPLLNFVQVNEGDEENLASVTDNGDDYARFNVTGNPFNVNQLVRISESTIEEYNGDWRIFVDAGYYLLQDVLYLGNATGKIKLLTAEEVDSDDQFLLLNAPNRNITDFSGLPDLRYVEAGTDIDTWAFAYFWIKFTSQPINNLKHALYFDKVNDPLAYQIGLKSNYDEFEQMAKDPVIMGAEAFLPDSVFKQIDFLTPLRVKTEKFNHRFYLNRNSGYKSSSHPCELELIKLS